MNRIHRIIAAIATLVGSLTALTAMATAPAAYASRPPGYGGPAGTQTTVRVITTGGMPGWQIALIAAVAALAGAILACSSTTPGRHARCTPPPPDPRVEGAGRGCRATAARPGRRLGENQLVAGSGLVQWRRRLVKARAG